MSDRDFSDDELLAYLDEMLPVERATEVEAALRTSSELRQRAALVRRRQENEVHSVGEIWRRGQISCPSRAELGNYLLGALDDEYAAYIEFHLRQVGCRICSANVDDLQRTQDESEAVERRRQRYFESSAGRLRSGDD